MMVVVTIAAVLLLAYGLAMGMAATDYPTAEDLSTPSDVPTPKGTLTHDQPEDIVSHEDVRRVYLGERFSL